MIKVISLVVMGLMLSGNAHKSNVISCSVEYASGIFYEISVDTDKDTIRISGPHMLWKGPVSEYSNPEGSKYYGNWGGQYLTLYVPQGSPTRASFNGEENGWKECK